MHAVLEMQSEPGEVVDYDRALRLPGSPFRTLRRNVNNVSGISVCRRYPRIKGRKETIEVLTVGHSTRSTKEFETLLIAHGVKQLADVRTIPRSRHNPQFNGDRLPRTLQKVGIRYRHMAELGGLRHARPDSVNTAWRNASFRGFADYMQTPEFKTALDRLIRLAEMRRTAIRCAEAVPWRCHRSLIADAFVVRGIHVAEITSGTRTRPHILTRWARVVRKQVTYPAPKTPRSNRHARSRARARAASAAHNAVG